MLTELKDILRNTMSNMKKEKREENARPKDEHVYSRLVNDLNNLFEHGKLRDTASGMLEISLLKAGTDSMIFVGLPGSRFSRF